LTGGAGRPSISPGPIERSIEEPMTRSGPADWGERLSDRIRRAIAAGDLAEARRLALDGDGQARSLAKEYALMVRGLGITLRVLLGLLAGRAARAAGAADALAALLARFRRDVLALSEGLPPDAGEDTERLLALAEARFTAQQARLADEAVRALEAGDEAAALAALDHKERGRYVPLHDRMVRFMAEAFGWVLDHFGAAELERFHLDTAEGQRKGFEAWERLTPAEFARATAFLLKQHMGAVEVHEDAERFTVVQRPCGSGGRLRLAGAYAGPEALPLVETPGPLTFGQASLPVYCSHCPIWNDVAPRRWFGHPHWVFEAPSRPDGSCTLHVEKRRDAAPADARLTVTSATGVLSGAPPSPGGWGGGAGGVVGGCE
jgi:hypothetical protein